MLKSVALLLVCVFAGTDASIRNRRSSGLIVGGDNAGKSSYPQFAAVFRNGELFCGGTILNRRSILTATNTFLYYSDVNSTNNDNFTVAVGKYRLQRDTGNEQYFNVKKLIFHEDFSMADSSNDIAILRLDGKIVYDDYVQPVVLSKNVTLREPKVLQSIATTVIKQKQCKRLQDMAITNIPRTPINKKVLCTKNIDAGPCYGDQGGPLGCYVADGSYVQYGISSYGSILCYGGLNIYTRVSQFKDWIKENA